LDEVEAGNLSELGRLRAMQHMSVVDYKLEPTAFEKHWNSINDLISDIYSRYFPWQGNVKKKAQDVLRQLWIDSYGDQNDPEVQKKIEYTVRQLENMQSLKKNEQIEPKPEKPRLSRLARR